MPRRAPSRSSTSSPVVVAHILPPPSKAATVYDVTQQAAANATKPLFAVYGETDGFKVETAKTRLLRDPLLFLIPRPRVRGSRAALCLLISRQKFSTWRSFNLYTPH
uniref:Uncharacterized protein n=1 Tax=Nelumbo nucifera TaxID=4432 RepID=A0A822YLN1_NELNU|nr:TPA_asm: hypothetical protein HUJ06_010756 [Nelumbo nucifera]